MNKPNASNSPGPPTPPEREEVLPEGWPRDAGEPGEGPAEGSAAEQAGADAGEGVRQEANGGDCSPECDEGECI